MSEWKEYRLGDICQTNRCQYSSKDNWQQFLYLDTGNITKGRINEIQEFRSFEDLPSRARRKVVDGDIVYSSVRPNQEHYGYIKNPPTNLLVSTGFVVISSNKEIINPVFLYYYLTRSEITNYLQAIGEQSVCTYPAIKPSDIEELLITIPSLEVQTEIATFLSILDDKIAVNRRICENLEAQAQALFKYWFVDFKPFEDGKFIESELGMIPEGWRVGNLFDIAEVHDSKRKPLSGMQRANMKKIYPYYGATEQMDMVDDYIFDGRYVLMGEDGSVVRENGLPYIQYVWGKIWVNNHAHVLSGKNGFTTEMLLPFLTKYNIKGLVTGAVQAKLSQANMARISLAIPPTSILVNISGLFDVLYDTYRKRCTEMATLSTLRDTLLPKLMSGQIKI